MYLNRLKKKVVRIIHDRFLAVEYTNTHRREIVIKTRNVIPIYAAVEFPSYLKPDDRLKRRVIKGLVEYMLMHNLVEFRDIPIENSENIRYIGKIDVVKGED